MPWVMIGHASSTGAAGSMHPSSPRVRNCGWLSSRAPRPDCSAMPMMLEPPPKVQKSAKTLWPLSAISQYHDGEGAPSKAGRVASAGGAV